MKVKKRRNPDKSLLKLVVGTDGREEEHHSLVLGRPVFFLLCIATFSYKMFSIPIWLSIDIYLILLITAFYKIDMIVKLTSWGRTSESWCHNHFLLKTMER